MHTPILGIQIRSSNLTRESKYWTWPFIWNRVRWRFNRNRWWPTWCPLVQSRRNSIRVSRNWPIPIRRESPKTLLREKEENIDHQSYPIYTNQWNLYKLGLDDILQRCALEHEIHDIIQEAHLGAASGYFLVYITIKKVLQFGLWWPSINKDCKNKIAQCDACQRIGRPLQKNEMPLLPIIPSLTFET